MDPPHPDDRPGRDWHTCPQCQHQFQIPAGDPSDQRPPSAGRSHPTVPADGPTPIGPLPVGGRRPVARGRTRWRVVAVAGVVLLLAGLALLTHSRRSGTVARWAAPHRGPESARASGQAPRGTEGPAWNELLTRGVVRIEAADARGARVLGAGFVIDASGLVATSLHVVAGAARAEACLLDGSRHRITGFAAARPELDLAILKLDAAPANLAALRLRYGDDPRPLSPVVAIGHPQGVEFSPYDGKVSRVLSTSQLPATSQQFLRRSIAGQQDHRWIQHTAVLAEGNSGGPLLNDRGEVIGINTWVDRGASFGYALHAAYLAELRGRVQDPVVPLHQYPAPAGPRAAPDAAWTAERVAQLHQAARAFGWQPQTGDQYAVLQQLAAAITRARFPESLAADTAAEDVQREALIRAADQVVADLEQQRWEGLGQFTLTNDLAQAALTEPRAGIFFFGVVQRVVSGLHGARGMLVQAAGSDQVVYIPLDGQLLHVAAGSQVLIVGVNDHGQQVEYGDNPLQPLQAPRILGGAVLLLE
jgi:hypothetical protein